MKRAAVKADATVVSSLTTALRGRVAQHRQQCNCRVVAAFGNQVQNDIRLNRFLAAELKVATAVGRCLGDLPGLAGTCAPKGDGKISERTTSHLDLAFDTYGGLNWAACVAYNRKGQQQRD